MNKEDFIKDELWLVTVNAAFQRANVYLPNANEQTKNDMKRMLRGLLEMSILSDYHNEVSDQKHIENINSVKNFSSNFSDILANGSFTFGVSQKILNLFLKVQWCLGRLKSIPPHFPVDRRIQVELGIKVPISWTTEMNEKEYLEIIELARKLAEKDNKSIAEYELENFRRRNI